MLKQRVLTAIVLLLALLLMTTQLTPFLFAVTVAGILLLAGYEWSRFVGLTDKAGQMSYVASLLVLILGLFLTLGISPDATGLDTARVATVLGLGMLFWAIAMVLLSGYPANLSYWNDPSRIALMGMLTLLPAWVGLVQLKYWAPGGWLVLLAIALVSVADIGAYFTGRAFGKRKLAPSISPNKSWAGVWGGMTGGLVLSILAILVTHAWFMPLLWWQVLVLAGCAAPVVLMSVVGDLFESMLKRNQGLKDSGSILPGHGGIMDRIDSLVAAVPLLVLLLMAVNGGR
ncbi:MAG: hypothetical protein RLZZ385_1054 [Pseudomonadota bacterium]